MNKLLVALMIVLVPTVCMAGNLNIKPLEYNLDTYNVVQGLSGGNSGITMDAMYDVAAVQYKETTMSLVRIGAGAIFDTTDNTGQRAVDMHGAVGLFTPKGLFGGSLGMNLTNPNGVDFVLMVDAAQMFKLISGITNGGGNTPVPSGIK